MCWAAASPRNGMTLAFNMLGVPNFASRQKDELQPRNATFSYHSDSGVACASLRSSIKDTADWLVHCFRKDHNLQTNLLTTPDYRDVTETTTIRKASPVPPYKVQTHEPYHYRPLNTSADEIRVLEVHAGQYTDALKCTVHNLSLQEPAIEYETISYSWGRSPKFRHLELDGKRGMAPCLAYRALKRMRQEHSSRFLWIYAVCINQSDLQERSQQVAMMSKVYSCSKGNLIYLGEHGSCAQAFESVRGVLEDAARNTSGFKHLEARVLDSAGTWKVATPFCPVVLKDRSAWDVFWSVPWFRRLWVSQEAILAPSNRCFYGDVSIDLLDIIRAAVWYLHNNRFLPTSPAIRQALLNMAFMWHSIDKDFSSRARHRNEKGDSVAYALTCARSFESLEPRDHIYGRLGLMQCTWQGIPVSLQPNYQKPVEDVFRNASWFSIREEGVDMIFPDVRHRSIADLERYDWKSRVPHWDVAWNENEDATELPWTRKCSGESQVSLTENNSLCIKGLLVDNTVAHTKECLQRSWFSRSHGANANRILNWLDEALDIIERAAKTPARTLPLQQTALEILGSTLLANSSCVTPSGLEQFRSFLLRNRRVPDVLYPHDSICSGGNGPSWKYQWAMRQHSQNRRVFATASGHVGIGPKIMEQADLVVAFTGACKFYVLRRCGSRHRLVGECYVYDCAPADAFSGGVVGDERELQSFELV